MTISTLRSFAMDRPPASSRPRLALVAPLPVGEDDAIARLASGDTDALGDLYDLHHRGVRAFAVRYLGDATTAEDLVQETFLALPGAIGRFRRDAPLRSFLLSIAANLAKNHVRSAARRRALAERAGRDEEREVEGPDDTFEREELARRLTSALDALSHDHRVAFVLLEVEERGGPEVADILGIPEATVRTRLFHAKKKLREILSKEER